MAHTRETLDKFSHRKEARTTHPGTREISGKLKAVVKTHSETSTITQLPR